MAWACIASSGTGSLIFIDDVTINMKYYKYEILCLSFYRKMQPNWLEDPSSCSKIVTQHTVPKQQSSSSGHEVEGFRLAKSMSTLKPCRVCILPAKEETEGSKPQTTAVKTWKSITEECKSLVIQCEYLEIKLKYWYLVSYSYFNIKPKWFQSTAIIKEFHCSNTFGGERK